MELEVLGGATKGSEGKDVSDLGEIHHMNLVNVGVDKQPRYFVLFANTLLILTYTSETNSLVYEGKIPVSGILLTNVPGIENTTNVFEIAGPMLEPILVRCLTKESKDVWLNHLSRILKLNRFPSSSQSAQQSFGHLSPPVQAWNIAHLRPPLPSNPFLSVCLKTSSKSKLGPLNKIEKNVSLTTVPSLTQLHGLNNSFSSSAPIVKNEEDLAVFNIADSFCSKAGLISAASIPTAVITPIKPLQTCGPEKLPRHSNLKIVSIS